MLEALAKSSRVAAQKLRVRSALNPLLWLTGIATPLCLGGAFAFRDRETIAAVLIVAALLPIVTACLGFVYFALRRPEKLQSEDYQLRHESLQLIQAKAGRIAIDPTSITAIANPALPALPSSTEGQR